MCPCSHALRGVYVRQAGTWDLLLKCCNACTWISPWVTKYEETVWVKKSLCARATEANAEQIIQRDQKAQLPLLKSPEKKQGTAHSPLHKTSPKGWANHLSHPSGLTPEHTPTLTPYKEQARPPLQGAGKPKGNLCVLTPPCCSRGPSKVYLNFLSGLW